MRALVFVFGMILLSCKGQAQDKINWISLEEAYKRTQSAPKKTIIDVYTGWCGWCKVMDKKTFTNPEVVKYINANYYAVKFDAETMTDIVIGGKTYKFNAEAKANDAAIALLGGKMSYPSIVYLDEQFSMIQPLPGYMEADEFHKIITYFGGNYHKKENFDTYKAGNYKTAFK
ncbi:MAG: thioredoxin family protein [Leadbetterella sp.]